MPASALEQPESRRASLLLSGLAFLLPLVVYLKTLCPTVYWDDAGELGLAAAVLGVSHPPGQPFYSLLGKLFCLFPVGSLGCFRTNLMSAVLGATVSGLSIRLFSAFPLSLRTRWVAGLLSSLFWAFGITVWDQSVVTENSTLHALFVVSLCLLLLRASRLGMKTGEGSRLFFFSSMLTGMAMANHPGLVFMGPAFLCLLSIKDLRSFLEPRHFMKLLAAFLLGWTAYALFLPLASERNPYINLGDPSTWDKWWWVFSVRQYQQGTPSGAFQNAPWLRLLEASRMVFFEDLPPGAWIFLLIGMVKAWRAARKLFWAFLAVLPVFLYLRINPNFINAYQIPFLLLMSWLTGMGAAALWMSTSRIQNAWTRSLCVVSLGIGFSFLAAIHPVQHFRRMDRSLDWSAEIFAREAFRSMDKPCICLTGSGYAFHILLHETFLRGKTDSVAVISRNVLRRSSTRNSPQKGLQRHLTDHAPWVSFVADPNILQGFAKANAGCPIYWEGLDFSETRVVESHRWLTPCGFFFKVCSDSECRLMCQKKDRQFWVSWWKWTYRDDGLQAGDDKSRRAYSLLKLSRGNLFFTLPKGVQRSMREYADAMSIDPKSAAAAGNFGAALAEMGRLQAAEPHLRRALTLFPGEFSAGLSLARLLMKTERQEEAREVLIRMAPYSPQTPSRLMEYGLLEVKAGLEETALHHLRKAYQTGPPGLRKLLMGNPACPEEMKKQISGEEQPHP